MTAEETISILKIAIAEVEWNYPMDYAVAIETAIQALEKQIPKKPIEEKKWLFSCPNCGSGNVEEWCLNRHNCCPDCGQALDWSEENAET